MSSRSYSLLMSGFSFWVICALVALYLLYPLRDKLSFGIDLVGGTYLSLLVDVDKAVEDELYERLEGFRREFSDARLEAPVTSTVENDEIILTFASTEAAYEAMAHLRGEDADLKQQQDGLKLRLSLPSHEKARIKTWAVESNIKVLRNRLDKFAVGDIAIAAQGKTGIVIELPNVDNPEQAKAMIGKSAQLEFASVLAEGASEEDILDQYDDDLPDGTRIVSERRGRGGQRRYYLVPRHNEVTGRYLRDAHPDFDRMHGGMVVTFALSKEGGDKFHELTSTNIGKLLAVILDGEIISVATIQSEIRDRGQISGNFTGEYAKELSLLFKSGAYVAPVKFNEERHIGATLGEQSIQQGLLACLIGLGLLFLFSIFYYGFPGLFAFVALLYNLLLILLTLSWFRATLTLPGIAGMVLTVGMAIDASILIYEKIREELAAGLTMRRAVEDGFRGAMVVILDANITTFIVGLVLFKLGTGPIQGFAVTMMIGIISTLITGMFFLRSLFLFVLDHLGVKTLRI